MDFDVAVIGGGTAGYASSVILGRRGKRVAVIEKENIGGTCVNYGCVPSIFLSELSFLYSRIKEIGNYKGINISVSIDGSSFFNKRDEIVNYLSSAGENLIRSSGGEIIKGEAEILGKNEVVINGEKVTAKNIIIASGSKPNPPQIEGIENAVSEDEAVRIKKIPSSIIVIGGGVAGTEIAQIFAKLGSEVTILSRGKVLKELEEDTRKIILEALEFDGVNVIEGVVPEKIKENKVVSSKGEHEGEVIVYATGRVPSIPKGASMIGIESTRNGIIVNNKLETSIKGIYAVGDVIDKEKRVAHLAYIEAIIASLNILGSCEEMDYEGVPQVIYTDPEIGVVGDKRKVEKYVKFPYTANTRAIIRGLRDGFSLIGIDKNGTIVYSEIIGDNAEELVNLMALAIRKRLTIRDLAFSIFAHPSLSEVMLNAARDHFDLDVDIYK
ncbi:dihydrolipoyl dehydrogenase family protein [Stygiolobus caldivivus]|uniref:Pyridine nucleotide-disulfide oxidoreductase n=1 Tax=Stygiolobus caldivivus TaxID=2824673 RepID=A0A8D5U4I8_9CREN|nr:NAD(P)/FAD-dependent oxidoreductase [Stygiolobus caldivivus]BCU69117.1 pyridine nucleotide-disulfide oxidoreductase [Stygiolobus caldivivus]